MPKADHGNERSALGIHLVLVVALQCLSVQLIAGEESVQAPNQGLGIRLMVMAKFAVCLVSPIVFAKIQQSPHV